MLIRALSGLAADAVAEGVRDKEVFPATSPLLLVASEIEELSRFKAESC